MKKRFLLILGILMTFSIVKSQNNICPQYEWVDFHHTNSLYKNIFAIASDKNGNSYVTGNFVDSLVIGNFVKTKKGARAIYIAKVDSNGNGLWAINSSTSYDITNIAVDPNANVIITGTFSGTITFGKDTLTSNDGLFVAKADSSGNWLWAKKCVGKSYYLTLDITTDKNSNIYISGNYYDSLVFNNKIKIKGINDIFLAKLDSSGNWTSANSYGGIGVDFTGSVTVDDNLNVYLTGSFRDSLTIGNNKFKSINNSLDIFVVKFDSLENLQWVKTAGGKFDEYVNSIKIDQANNIYIGGSCSDTSIFGSITLINGSTKSIFLSKMDSNGNWLKASSFGNAVSGRLANIEIGADNNPVVSGQFNGSLELGNISSYNNTTTVFYMKLDTSCAPIYFKKIPFNSTVNSGYKKTFTLVNNNIIMIGSISFNFDSYLDNYRIYGQDFFIAKLNTNNQSTLTLDSMKDVSIRCGEKITLAGSSQNFSDVLWSPSIDLDSINKLNPIASPQSTTTYTLNVFDNCGYQKSKEVTVFVNPMSELNINNDTTIVCGISTKLFAELKDSIIGVKYKWKPKLGLSDTNIYNPIANPIITSTYTVTVTGPTGCFIMDSTTIKIIPYTIDAGTDTNIICGNSVQFLPKLSDSIPNINYVWTPNSFLNNDIIKNPLANPNDNKTYMLKATTSKGCIAKDSISINVKAFSIEAGLNSQITCGNELQLNAKLSDIVTNINYRWTPNLFLTNDLIINPIANPNKNQVYRIKATTSNGCSADDTLEINVVPFTIEAGKDVSFDCGSSVQLSAELNDIVTSIKYKWNPEIGLSDSEIKNPIASPMTPTEYQVTASSTNGCSASDKIKVSINNTTKPSVNITSNKGNFIFCDDGVELSVTGFELYKWSTGEKTPSIIVKEPGWYSIEATNSGGCIGIDSVQITTMAEINTPDGALLCAGQSNKKLRLTATSGMDSYDWNTGEKTQTIEVDKIGYYTVKVKKGNCSYTVSQLIETGNGQAVAEYTYTVIGLSVDFNNTSTNIDSSFWDFGDGSTSIQKNPSHTFNLTGNYDVKLKHKDICGNIAEKTKTIYVSGNTGSINITSSLNNVLIYPNPTTNKITMKFAGQIQQTLYCEILNIQGQVLCSWQLHENPTIEIGMIPAGVYMLKLKIGDEEQIKRIIKLDN